MALNDLLKDMGRLEAELRRFEARFGVKSKDFHDAMQRGDLEEFDALDDYRMDFVEWLALYKTWASLDDWYDSFPHPNDPSLASTDPHHKHAPPDIKRHRIPAPDLSFTRPNLPFLIEEIERELLSGESHPGPGEDV